MKKSVVVNIDGFKVHIVLDKVTTVIEDEEQIFVAVADCREAVLVKGEDAKSFMRAWQEYNMS